MKTIRSLTNLSRVFKTFPVEYPEGVLSLSSSQGNYAFSLHEMKLASFDRPGYLPARELRERLIAHHLIGVGFPEVEELEELWRELELPELFRLHKSRFRELVYCSFLRQILQIDFEEGLPATFVPGAPPQTGEFSPMMSLPRFAADILENTEDLLQQEIFPFDAVFLSTERYAPELRYESLLILQLLKEPRSYIEVIQESFFPPVSTTEYLQELVRLGVVACEYPSSNTHREASPLAPVVEHTAPLREEETPDSPEDNPTPDIPPAPHELADKDRALENEEAREEAPRAKRGVGPRRFLSSLPHQWQGELLCFGVLVMLALLGPSSWREIVVSFTAEENLPDVVVVGIEKNDPPEEVNDPLKADTTVAGEKEIEPEADL